MKTFAARVILFYSTILAIFVVVSGALQIKSIEQALFLMIFAPVFIYLFVTSIKEVRRMFKKEGPSNLVTLSGKKTEFIAGIIIFVVLLVFGFRNLTKVKSADNISSDTKENAIKTDETSPIIFEGKKEEMKKLLVKIEDGSQSVNLRTGPGTFNEIAGEVGEGQEFEYTEVSQGWYKIDFEGTEAWIFENYVEEIND